MISSQGITTFVTFKISGLSSMPSPININNTSILLGKTTILTNLTLADTASTILNNTTNKGSLFVLGNSTFNSPLYVNSDISSNTFNTTNLNTLTLDSSTVNTIFLNK